MLSVYETVHVRVWLTLRRLFLENIYTTIIDIDSQDETIIWIIVQSISELTKLYTYIQHRFEPIR